MAPITFRAGTTLVRALGHRPTVSSDEKITPFRPMATLCGPAQNSQPSRPPKTPTNMAGSKKTTTFRFKLHRDTNKRPTEITRTIREVKKTARYRQGPGVSSKGERPVAVARAARSGAEDEGDDEYKHGRDEHYRDEQKKKGEKEETSSAGEMTEAQWLYLIFGAAVYTASQICLLQRYREVGGRWVSEGNKKGEGKKKCCHPCCQV